MTAVMGALSRGTFLHDLGYLEIGMQTSFESIVLGDELAGFAKALLREFAVDDEALAVDEIMSVGPGGNHLARPYTRSHYRDFWMPTLLDKAPHDRWRSGGATALKQRVQSRVASSGRSLGHLLAWARARPPPWSVCLGAGTART